MNNTFVLAFVRDNLNYSLIKTATNTLLRLTEKRKEKYLFFPALQWEPPVIIE